MPDSPAPALWQPALDGEARIVEIQERVFAVDLLGGQKLGICAIQEHRITAPHPAVLRGSKACGFCPVAS